MSAAAAGVAALVAALAAGGAPARGAPAPAPADSAAHATHLRADGLVLAGCAALGTIAAVHDRDGSNAASRDQSPAARDLATLGRQFGEPLVIAPALLGADALARLAGHPHLGAAAERVALAAACASAVTLALGQALGRDRPDEPPGSPGRFTPFSGHDALPSAHTTLAFALATGIGLESGVRALPAVLGTAATLTAWSRVHDRRHWPSDVVAGAVVGTWVSARIDAVARRRLPDGLLVRVWPGARGARAGVQARF